MRRWSGLLSSLFALLVIGAASPAPAIEDQPLPPSCEPSTEVAISARILSQSLDHGRGVVRVEVTVDTLVDIAAAGLRVSDGKGEDLVSPDLPMDVGPQPRNVRRRLSGTVDLPDGDAREIAFHLESEEASGTAYEGTALVRVDFDPAHQPILRGDVIEYRAHTRGR